jgi:hypothetical protein
MAIDLLTLLIVTTHRICELLWSNILRVNENILIHHRSLLYIRRSLFFEHITNILLLNIVQSVPEVFIPTIFGLLPMNKINRANRAY